MLFCCCVFCSLLENLSVSKAKHCTENESIYANRITGKGTVGVGTQAGLEGRKLRQPRPFQPNLVVVQLVS